MGSPSVELSFGVIQADGETAPSLAIRATFWVDLGRTSRQKQRDAGQEANVQPLGAIERRFCLRPNVLRTLSPVIKPRGT